jgi:uncharacterized protein (UPF0147 family)
MNNDIKRNIGRPIGAGSFRAMAARRAREAVDVLAEVAQDSNNPSEARVKAAGMLLSFSIKELEHEKEPHS